MTEDGALLAGNSITYRGDDLANLIDDFGSFTVTNEPTGDLMIYEHPAGWHVTSPDENGIELFSIVEQDGTMLIKFHETWRGGS